MELLYKGSLLIHIISGFSALTFGLIAILAKKGQSKHKLSGFSFFICMLAVAASGFTMAMIKNNVFLLHIALFALYQNVSGYRAIKNKSLKPNWLDYSLWVVAIGNSFFMLYSMNMILLVFGSISTLLVFTDLKTFILHWRKMEIPNLLWLTRHIGVMMGTYIATASAFLVVNLQNFDPYWVPWLMPTAIGVPIMMYFTRKFVPKKREEVVNS
jgi:hypothetical protein